MELIIVKAAPAGVYIAFSIALYTWHVATSLLGVCITEYFAVKEPIAPRLDKIPQTIFALKVRIRFD